jgi:hypothetical protein
MFRVLSFHSVRPEVGFVGFDIADMLDIVLFGNVNGVVTLSATWYSLDIVRHDVCE